MRSARTTSSTTWTRRWRPPAPGSPRYDRGLARPGAVPHRPRPRGGGGGRRAGRRHDPHPGGGHRPPRHLSFPTAIAAGALGTYIADLVWFLVGKWRGPPSAIPGCTGTSDPRSSVGPAGSARSSWWPAGSSTAPGSRAWCSGADRTPADPVPADRPGRGHLGRPGLRRPRLGPERQHHVLVGHIRRVELVLLVALIIGGGIVLWLRPGGRGRGRGK